MSAPQIVMSYVQKVRLNAKRRNQYLLKYRPSGSQWTLNILSWQMLQILQMLLIETQK